MKKFKDTINFNRCMGSGSPVFFSSNMRASSIGGLVAGYSLENKLKRTASTPKANMSKIVSFAQYEISNYPIIFGLDTEGDMNLIGYDGTTFFRAMNNTKVGGVNYMTAVIPGNEFIYTSSTHIGKTVTITLAEDLDTSETEIDVSADADLDATGYGIILGGDTSNYSTSEVIYWGAKGGNTLTSVTRGALNSTASTHLSGDTLICFVDDWKDMASIETYRPILRFENRTFIGNGSYVAGWKETDFSDWSATRLTLPADYEIVDFGLLTTSGVSYVLVGANKGNSSSIFVWDGVDTTWLKTIDINGRNIEKMDGNIVALTDGIYQTDGLTMNKIIKLPDYGMKQVEEKMGTGGLTNSGDFIYFTTNVSSVNANKGFNRNKSGLWVYDKSIDSLSYVLCSNKANYGTSFGAIGLFGESNQNTTKIFLSTDYNSGAIDQLLTEPSADGTYFSFLYYPGTTDVRKLKKMKIGLSLSTYGYYSYEDMTFDIILRYYDFKKPFIKTQILDSASSDAGEIILDTRTTDGVPSVYDRIEIIQNNSATYVDCAGQPRNITSVVAGTGKYTCQLDSDLNATIDATTAAAGLKVLLNPLKYVGTISVDASSLDTKDLEIDLTDLPESKRYMFELELRYTKQLFNDVNPKIDSVDIIGDVINKY